MYPSRRFLVPLTSGRYQFVRISHLSPLADTFNALRPSPDLSVENTQHTGLFGNRWLISPAGFNHLVNDATKRCSELLREAVSSNRTRKMVQILDDMSDSLCRAADLADCVRTLHPDCRFREAASLTCEAIGSLVEELNTVPELYAASIRASSREQNSLLAVDRKMDAIDRRVLDLFIADFELSGVQLKDPIRQADFVRAATAAMSLGSEFVQTSHTPVPFRLTDRRTGCDEVIELIQPLTDEPRPDVREASYRAFYAPIPGQEERLIQLLLNRHHMACAAGFNKYTDRATMHSLASSTECVDVFLTELCRSLAPVATRTAHEHLISEVVRERTSPPTVDHRLGPWDVGYALGSKRQLVQYSELCDYFSIGACMEGVSQLADCLFGLRLRVEPVVPGETWDPTVVKVGVYGTRGTDVGHNENGLLGWVYCDLLDRPGKPMQDCHYTIQGGRSLEHGGYQKPIITLQLTLSPPVQPGVPCLLTPGQVENLFHEWGHAFHSMLARTRYQHVTGTRCSTDLAEVPSTLFEHFALDPRVAKEYARHWRTGAAPGIQELEALQRLAIGVQLGSSLEVMQQASYARLDQILHSGPPEVTLGSHNPPGAFPASSRLLSRIQVESGLSDWLSCDARDLLAWPHRFAHLIGYGGRYYAYLMARAGAHLIWENCFARDPWSSSNGETYANSVLRLGGEYPAAQMLATLLLATHGDGSDRNNAASCSVESTLSADQLARSLISQVEGDEAAAADLLKRLNSPGLHQPRVTRRTP